LLVNGPVTALTNVPTGTVPTLLLMDCELGTEPLSVHVKLILAIETPFSDVKALEPLIKREVTLGATYWISLKAYSIELTTVPNVVREPLSDV
jgi:hypothetical protein